jgi:hypothetical protein
LTDIARAPTNQLNLQLLSAGLKTEFDLDWKDGLDVIRPKFSQITLKIPETGLLSGGSWYLKFMYDDTLYVVE